MFLLDVEGDRYVKSGSWDSIHVVEAGEANNKTSATYKLTTTIMLSMSVERQEVGETLLSGSLTRQVRFHCFSKNSDNFISMFFRLS
jgi:hypothetical protein